MLVATAGHVDHGKTSLVRHLTGIDTDRLEEEKKRGLTIELGYAFRDTAAGEPIGFIDVPGHRKFINTMIAGISGIDLGLLVVAADDGPMPQTLEHLEILRMLGVQRFAAVVSKRDLVDQARLEEVAVAVGELVPGAPLCVVSNRTGEGLDELESLLELQNVNCGNRQTESQFRMFIDRVFVKKGAGLVVTGTCLSGAVEIGDSLRLHRSSGHASDALDVRVREVHSQGQVTSLVHAGQRCALNISGSVSREQLQRGDFLCAHPSADPAHRLDTRCWVVDSVNRPLKHLGRVKLHLGTRRIGARTYLLDGEPGDDAGQRVQLILDNDVLCFAGDRFVLRDDNESATLGGGIVIDPDAPRWGKSRPGRLRQLSALECGEPAGALYQLLFVNGDTVNTETVKRIWNLSQDELENLIDLPGIAAGNFVRLRQNQNEFILSNEIWEQYAKTLDRLLCEWHESRPMEPGIPLSALQTLTRGIIPERLFKLVLDHAVDSKKLIHEGQLVRASGHKPTLSPLIQRQWQQLDAFLVDSGPHLPLRSEIMRGTGFDSEKLEQLTRPAIKRGELLEIGDKRLALPAILLVLADKLHRRLLEAQGISVIEAKHVFGLGRNLTIEILEFFDGIGYTKRERDVRVIADLSAVDKLRH